MQQPAPLQIPPGSFDYEQIPGGYYDAIFKRARGIQSKWHHLKFEYVRSRLSDSPLPGVDASTLKDLLDIGCGPGTFIGTLDASYRAVGVDISHTQLKFAGEHYANPQRSFLQIGQNLSLFAAESFDFVMLIELIEHLPAAQAEELLQEAWRVVRPGGKLVITTPNYAGLWPWVEMLVNRLSPLSYAEQHLTQYTQESLNCALLRVCKLPPSIATFMLLAPFTAALSWRLADYIARFERRWLNQCPGLLLFAEVQKT
jgi:SAM-dependent methyltransferase